MSFVITNASRVLEFNRHNIYPCVTIITFISVAIIKGGNNGIQMLNYILYR